MLSEDEIDEINRLRMIDVMEGREAFYRPYIPLQITKYEELCYD
ncbi:hypothetical protein UGMREWDR_CDS0092 [Aeromonas phage GomatiRiver_11]|nr:hypothetical protein OBDJBBDK_00085 [Aeromonas phage AhFM11]WKW84259.1 hypothetical protein UGMREWDR_CDS0092 [Aeromonas phage GomatiRiver_11]